MKTEIPLLADVRVASPCPAAWSLMEGDDRTRHCKLCRKNVYNLSEMTTVEAENLIRENEGHLCVRYFQRADGTILTRDCPVGSASVRRALFTRAATASALLVSIIALFGRDIRAMVFTNSCATTGDVAMDYPTPPVAGGISAAPPSELAEVLGNMPAIQPRMGDIDINIKEEKGKVALPSSQPVMGEYPRPAEEMRSPFFPKSEAPKSNR